MNETELPPVVQSWLNHLHRQGKSEHTIAAYRRGVAHFVRWSETTYGEAFDPARVIPRDVRDWLAHQQTVEKARPATINQRLTALKRFFAWAVREGHARTDPTADVSGLRLPQRRPKALTDKEVRRLLRAVHAEGNVRDIAMVEVLLGTGIRVGELLALRVGDVVIRERSGVLTVRRGKHGQYRQVPLTAPVRKALAAYLEVHPERENPDAPLWWGQRGPLKDRSAVLRILRKYALRAGIDDFGPHTLRHTFATRYLAANPGDLRGLAALLGHASLNTVMVYTEPRLEDLAERMERVG